MNIYEVYHKPTGFRDDDRVFVAANDNGQARAIAKKLSPKARDWDYIHIRAKRNKELDYMLHVSEPLGLGGPSAIDKPMWLFDNETYENTLEDVRRWFDSQCF